MSLLHLLVNKSTPENSVRVRFVSATRARAADKRDTQHVNAGEILDISAADACALIGDGIAERVGSVKNGEFFTDNTTPVKTKSVPAKPEPLPSNFAGLPAAFADAWNVVSKRRALVVDLQAARESALPPGFLAASKMPKDLEFYVHAHVGEAQILERMALGDEAEGAEDLLKAHDKAEGYHLASAIAAAGRPTLALTEKANAAGLALAEIGFDIFALRVAALELSRAKVYSLFVGSTLAVRFASFTPLTVCDAVFTGGKNNDTAIDLPIEGIACYYLNAAARLAEIEPLLAEASAQLSAALGTTPKAAKK